MFLLGAILIAINLPSHLKSSTDKVFEGLSAWMNIFNYTYEALSSITEL